LRAKVATQGNIPHAIVLCVQLSQNLKAVIVATIFTDDDLKIIFFDRYGFGNFPAKILQVEFFIIGRGTNRDESSGELLIFRSDKFHSSPFLRAKSF